MIEIINSKHSEQLTAKLKRIRERSVALDTRLMDEVAQIITNVRTRGDAALIEYAAQFDGYEMSRAGLRVAPARLLETARQADETVLRGLREAIRNVRA